MSKKPSTSKSTASPSNGRRANQPTSESRDKLDASSAAARPATSTKPLAAAAPQQKTTADATPSSSSAKARVEDTAAAKRRLEARANLSPIIEEVSKTFGEGALMLVEDKTTQHMDAISTGSWALDRALGIGGYPRGRIIEIFGPESSGKTTLTLHAIAQVQQRGGVAAFIDAEHAFDVQYARAIGIDTKQLLVSQPDCGEQGLEIAEFLTKTGAVDLVVVDSVAALVPRAEIQGDMGEPHMGLQARLMSQALRKLASVSNKNHTTFIFINQLRQKIGVVFGNPETTTGGHALKFYASVRLDVRRIGKVTAGDEVVGNRTRVKVVKNKCAHPFTEAEFDIRWGIGIDHAGDLLDAAVQQGVVAKNGAHYNFDGSAIGHGKEKAREHLLNAPDLQAALAQRLLPCAAAPPELVARSAAGYINGAAHPG